jgi:hypothetical protein
MFNRNCLRINSMLYAIINHVMPIGAFISLFSLAIGMAVFPVKAFAQSDRIPEYFGIFFDGKGTITEFGAGTEMAWLKGQPDVVISRSDWNPLKTNVEETGSIVIYDEQYNPQNFQLLEYLGSAVQGGEIYFQVGSIDLRVGPVQGTPAPCYRLMPKTKFDAADYILVYEPKKGVIEKAWQFAVYRDRRMNPIREEVVSLASTAEDSPSIWGVTPGGLFAKYETGWTFQETRGHTAQLIACDPQQADALFTVFDPEGLTFHRTPDRGKTWVKLSLPSEMKANMVVVYRPSRINAVAVSPVDPNRILIGAEGTSGLGGKTTGMIIQSEDGGLQWKIRKSDCPILKTVCFDPTNPEIAYAGTGNEMLRSENGGKKWENIKGSPKGVIKMAIDPLAGTIIVWSPFGAFRSSDQGVTWEKLSGWKYSVIAPFTGIEFLQSPSGGSVIFVSCNKGVFKSTDNGDSWNDISQGLADTNVRSIAANRNLNCVYAATATGIFASSDGGTSWNAE